MLQLKIKKIFSEYSPFVVRNTEKYGSLNFVTRSIGQEEDEVRRTCMLPVEQKLSYLQSIIYNFMKLME